MYWSKLYYLALEIYGCNINIIQIIAIYWCFYCMICESIANIFKHICYYLALNDASFSISQCYELQAITSLTKTQSLCFLKSDLYLCWISIVFTDILCPLLGCSIRIRISCLVSLFHIVPLLPVVCCCFLACLGILDNVLSVFDTYLRFNRNTNVIFESTT